MTDFLSDRLAFFTTKSIARIISLKERKLGCMHNLGYDRL